MKPFLSFFLYALCVFAIVGNKPVAAQTADPNFYITNGSVLTSVLSGNTLYVGGEFSQVGLNTPNGAALSTTTGLPNTAYAKPNARVLTCVPDGSGGWYVGGEFTQIGTVPRNRLAHLLASGAVDMNWDPNLNNSVRTLLLNGTTLYAGGDFTTVGGQNRNYLAALSTATGQATSFNPNLNGYVNSMAGGDITLIVAGGFTMVNGQPYKGIASIFVSSGNPTGWNPAPDSTVSQVAIIGSNVYAVGKFTQIGGQQRKYLAALDGIGNATAFNANIGGSYVDVLAVHNNTVYISGAFDTAGGAIRAYFAALDATTGQATSWNPSPNSFVRSIAFSANGATVYLAGTFNQISGVTRHNLAAVNATTGVAASWDPNPSGGSGIVSIAVSGNTAYIGGDFKMLRTEERYDLAAFDVTTGRPTPWNPSTNGFVNAMAKSGNTLYIGGSFSDVNGQGRLYLAGVDMTSGALTEFAPAIHSNYLADMVEEVAVENNTLYIGGYFNNIDNNDEYYERNRLASFNATTGQLTDWNPDAGNGAYGITNIRAMAVAGNTVYVSAWDMAYIGGQYRNGLAALDATTGQVTPWAPIPNGGSPDGRVNALAVSPDASTVYVGGTFTNIGGQARYGLAAISAATGQATSWNPNPNAETTTLFTNGNTVYVGGSFTSIGGQARVNLAAVNANTGLPTPWNLNLNGGSVNTLTAAGGIVYAGGGGLSVYNQPVVSLLAISAPPNAADYFRTVTSGDWNSPSTWESSADGVDYRAATLSPDFNASSIVIQNGHTATITANVTIDQTTVDTGGSIVVNSAATLTIADGTGWDLVVNGAVSVNSGANMIIRSTALGTASVGNSGGNVTGIVTYERFVNVKRAWRLTTAPLSNANTIREAWQNGGVYTPAIGTFITGPGGLNGLDSGNSYSLKSYNVDNQQLQNVTNTNVSLSSSNGSADNKGYFLFVRGDRDPINLTPPNANFTTLSAKGNLQLGTQTFTQSATAGNFMLVGNPYASPVDFNLITRSNVAKRFYVWDPSLNAVGGYVLVDDADGNGVYTIVPGTSQTEIIQSGHAVFVQAENTGATTVTFNESSKSNVVTSAGFRLNDGSTEVLRTNLYQKNDNNITTLVDGVLSEYNNDYEAAVNMQDAMKMSNINENLAIQRGSHSLSIERRPLVDASDTLFFKLTDTTTRNYRFEFVPSNFPTQVSAWLEDSYLNTATPVDMTTPTMVDFRVTTSVPASASSSRFRIVFRAATTLPVTFTTVKAFEKGDGIEVNWNVATESNIKLYEVEKSADGSSFNKIADVSSVANNNTNASYGSFDELPFTGSNFYRIKAVEKTGEVKYSEVVKVIINKGQRSISVYPTIVNNGILNLKLNNQPKGNYAVELFNGLGQKLFTKTLKHIGGSTNIPLQLPSLVSKGVYQVKITNGEIKKVAQVIVN